MTVVAIRGAITIEKNTREGILENTRLLLEDIFKSNKLRKESVIQITFTATKDITAAYPAIAARELGLTHAALMCTQEMYVEGSLPLCIRVAVQVQDDQLDQSKAVHCYLKGASILRPDLIKH